MALGHKKSVTMTAREAPEESALMKRERMLGSLKKEADFSAVYMG
jgi:hypothetical protein